MLTPSERPHHPPGLVASRALQPEKTRGKSDLFVPAVSHSFFFIIINFRYTKSHSFLIKV